jgi:hypothetical protein
MKDLRRRDSIRAGFAFFVCGCTASTMPMPIRSDRIDVELDIFSGMPNPTWVLTASEAGSFDTQLAALPQTAPRSLAGNLGYRGLIVQMRVGTATQLVRIQTGLVQVSDGTADAYCVDEARKLERWLLQTGKPHVNGDILRVAERELR